MSYMLDTYFPGRTDVFISQLRKAKLFPEIDAPVYLLNGNQIFINKVNPGDVLACLPETEISGTLPTEAIRQFMSQRPAFTIQQNVFKASNNH